MRINVFTLGCKVNRYESERIGAACAVRGFSVYYGLDRFAEVCVINTCAVTAEAERKSRQAVARVLRVSRHKNNRLRLCGRARHGGFFG
jgi:threonylcarbamoyladenosine tRNA methylthiotransferase MtaB